MEEAKRSVNPQVGMVAAVRNRRGVVASVRRYGTPVLHLVDVEYNDGESPVSESLVWEREASARLIAPGALPDPVGGPPMAHEDVDALIRACRWTARTPYVDPDAEGPLVRLPITAPFHGAVQVEAYQIYPLLKALRMPRVSLLIGDDVGLGKTIEAGLILSELFLRRRIRRVLILTPASLRVQWRDEMWSKFALPFEIVDRQSTLQLRRQLGMDANPWRSHSRIIASYHYLKQPDVLTEFMAAGQGREASTHLPWDLLIVDEAHNLTPVPFGQESDLCKMLRQVAPLFEHRIFASATPHNGYTRSFTGLLEMLDPVRFSQTDDLKPAERDRVREVLVRRLKREINARSNPKRFSERLPPQALLLALSPAEEALMDSFSGLRARLRKIIKDASRQKRIAGNFAIEILGKRLLSCPATFADSWRRCKAGMAEAPADEAVVVAAQKAVAEDCADDREAESRSHSAASTVGSWLKPMMSKLETEIKAVDAALSGLNLDPSPAGGSLIPSEDSRYAALVELIESRLRADKHWRQDERLVVFTEYMTTLTYLLNRMRAQWPKEQDRILCLYGGMDDPQRESIKRAFNDPNNPVRILIATDAAAEGLNLQETARYLLHFDVPWVPSRVEQRNGRLDRHGQARNVETWHFVARNNEDISFLDMLVRKVDTIREDLGATGDVFDEITYRRLVDGEPLEDIRADLDQRIEAARKRAEIPRDDKTTADASDGEYDAAGDLAAISAELDLSPGTLRETLDSAMAMGFGRPRVTPPDENRLCALVPPHPPAWTATIDDAVRLPTGAGVPGPIPHLAFDPEAFIVRVNGRSVFRPRPDSLLLHLAHPMFQKGLSLLTRQRFTSGGPQEASRWTVRVASLKPTWDAVVALTVEELAINGLRENFHHWVRTVRFPVVGGRIQKPLPHEPAAQLHQPGSRMGADWTDRARDIWSDVEQDLKDHLKIASKNLAEILARQVDDDRARAAEDETQRYQSRQGELSTLIENSTLRRLERELVDMRALRQQGLLFDQQETFDDLDRNIEEREEELKRRRTHYEELRTQLAKERERIVNEVIPQRYRIEGPAQVMPIAVEIILPEAGS